MWSLPSKILKHLLAILMGYDRLATQVRYLEEGVHKSNQYVETRLATINGEMGRIDKSLDQVREDVAFIRGKLDR